MPLRGTRCRWLTGEEQFIPTDTCVACATKGTNPCQYPLPFIRSMLRDRDPNVVQCSSTMIGGCAREAGIKKNYDYFVNPDHCYTRAFGSVVHAGVETLSGNLITVEKRYNRTFVLEDGREVKVTSQVDALHLPAGVIIDYKVVDSLADGRLRQKIEGYLPQFSIMRWVLKGNGIDVTSIDLHFVKPKERRVVNIYPDGDIDFPGLRVWGFKQTEAYLQERLPSLVDSLGNVLSPPLEGTEIWRCYHCDVRSQCEALYGRPIPASASFHKKL